jgi:outer membrane cobalamin receptor
MHVPSSAQEDSEEPETEYRVETVRDLKQFATDPRYPSGYMTEIEIDDEPGSSDLTDLVEESAGTNLRQTGGTGQSGFLTVRGGNSRESKILVNDMPVGISSGLGFDLSRFALSGIDRIAIRRGPAAIIDGSGALTGSMGIDIQARQKTGSHMKAQAGGGSFGTYAGGSEVGLASDGAGAELTLNWRRSRGDFEFIDRQGTRHTRRNSHHNQLNAIATGYQEIEDHQIDVTALWSRWSGGVPGVSEFQGRFAETRQTENHIIGISNWEKKGLLEGDSWVIDANGYLGTEMLFNDYDNTDVFPGGGTFRQQTDVYAVRGGLRQKLWSEAGHLFQTALRTEYQLYDGDILQSPDSRATDIDATRLKVEFSLFDEFIFLSDRVSLIGGATGIFLDDDSNSTATETLESEFAATPTGGTIIRAADWLKFKGNVGYSYRPPDFDEKFTRMTGVRGNPELAPERALLWDGGVQLGRKNWPVRLSATYFENRIDNYIQFVSRSAYLYEAANLDNTSIRGVEGSLIANPIERIGLNGNYTWTEHATYGQSRLPLPGRPDHRIHGQLDYEAAGLWFLDNIHSLKFFGQVRYRSLVSVDPFGNLQSPAYTAINAGASLEPVPGFDASLRVKNITDNQSRTDFFQRPLPGRSYFFNIELIQGADSNE